MKYLFVIFLILFPIWINTLDIAILDDFGDISDAVYTDIVTGKYEVQSKFKIKSYQDPGKNIKTYDEWTSVTTFMFGSDAGPNKDVIKEMFDPPVIEAVSNTAIIEPTFFGDAVAGYNFSVEYQYYEDQVTLRVTYNCQKKGSALLSMNIKETKFYESNPEIPDSTEFKIYWMKKCGTESLRAGFTIETELGDKDVVKHGWPQLKWEMHSGYWLEDPTLIDETASLSYFDLYISDLSFGNQNFFEPIVQVFNPEIVDVTVRGHGAYGGVATAQPQDLVFLYICKATGISEILVTIPLGDLYDDVFFGWSKKCVVDNEPQNNKPANPDSVTVYEDDGNNVVLPPSNIAEAGGFLNVGIPPSQNNIVTANEVSKNWSTDNPEIIVPSDEHKTQFFVSSSERGEKAKVYSPIISVSPPGSLSASVLEKEPDSILLDFESPKIFTITYFCQRVSEATITISLHQPAGRTVEFSYIKQCSTITRYTPYYWTANRLLVLFIITLSILSCTGYYYYRKYVYKKKAPPPTVPITIL